MLILRQFQTDFFMKKAFIYLFLLLISAPLISSAQLTYNLADTTLVNLPDNNIDQKTGFQILNAMNNTGVFFEWRVIDYDIPHDWVTTGICDWFGCYPLHDTAWHKLEWQPLLPKNEVTVDAKRNIGVGDGCAIVQVEYREQGISNTNVTNIILTSYSNVSICNPLSVVVKEKNNRMQVYPNPCKDFLQIVSSNSTSSFVEVSTILGKRVSSAPIFDSKGSLSTQDLRIGMYILSLKGKDGSVLATSKFLKE